MKFLAGLITSILFIPLFIILLITATLKYQLLNPVFWQSAFDQNNVYPRLSDALKVYIENQTQKSGGNKSDVKVITDIITPDIIRDFISKNSLNLLDFANGKSKVLMVYLPINKLPNNMVPKSVGLDTGEIPLTALLSKFNIGVSSDLPISQIAYIGVIANDVFIIGLATIFLFLVILFHLAGSGKRLTAPAVPITITGFIILVLVFLGHRISFGMQTGLDAGSELRFVIPSIIVPVILQEVLKNWLWVGFLTLGTGLTLFFVRKPQFEKHIL